MQLQRLLKAFVPVLSLFVLFACSKSNQPAPAANAQTAPAVEAQEETPPGPGDVGVAVTLASDLTRGAAVYKNSCVACHGAKGEGNVANPGSKDGTVPPLNPIDESIASPDIKAFTKNIDIYIEHGSTPEGLKPSLSMPAFGDKKKLTPQQNADVIAYTISIGRR
jgi:mono/diheme cytochrome c family protein